MSLKADKTDVNKIVTYAKSLIITLPEGNKVNKDTAVALQGDYIAEPIDSNMTLQELGITDQTIANSNLKYIGPNGFYLESTNSDNWWYLRNPNNDNKAIFKMVIDNGNSFINDLHVPTVQDGVNVIENQILYVGNESSAHNNEHVGSNIFEEGNDGVTVTGGLLAANTTNIAANTTNITANTNNITANTNNITANTNNITANTNNISNLQTNVYTKTEIDQELADPTMNTLTVNTSANLTNLSTTGRVNVGTGGMKITAGTSTTKKLSYSSAATPPLSTAQNVNIGLEVESGLIWISGFSNLNWSGSVQKTDGLHTNQSLNNNTSFYAIGRIITGGNVVYSSKKLKNVESSLDDTETMTEAISLFKSIPNSKYTYKDKDMKDGYTHFGLIAESMPNSIFSFQSVGFAPNIYQIGIYENKTIKVTNPINLAEIENTTELQILYHQDNIVKELKITEFTFVDEYTISFENDLDVQADDNYFFVYGTLENIPGIEKESYFELTSCVVKNLLERIEMLELKISELESK